MLVDKFVLVVTFFVFTSKPAQPFILLTANVADIKKIAQKFVSEDLADKLAHTVVRIIDNLNRKKGSNIEDELNKLEFTSQTHEEFFKNEKYERNEQFEIHKNDQQRFKKATRNPDEDFTFKDSRETQGIYKDEFKKATTKYLNNWEMNLKTQDAAKSSSEEEPIAEMKAVSHQQKQKPALLTRTTKKPVEYTIRTTPHITHNYESNEIKSRYVPDLKQILTSEPAQKNEKVFDNNPSSDRKKKKKRNRFALKNADDVAQYVDNKRQPNKSHNSEEQETEKVTTKREKYEFDQYDNLNYPKDGNYIATSGPVALSVRPSEKQWWEKDLPDRRKF